MSDQEVTHVPPLAQHGHQTALHRAAMVGNSEVISALIQGGCALDLQDKDGNTALHEVSWHGFSQCVKLLVKAGADVHARNKAGNTGLHLACQNAHAQSARILLLGGSSPDTKNHVGDTCLHVAARYNHLAMVKILLGALCSVTEKNQAGDTALHVAAALNHKKTVQLLLEAGTDGNARNNAGKTALDKARDQNHRDVALLLARAPQVHRFTRGRTVRKRRDRLKAERRTQSVTRDEMMPNKDSGSLAEDSHSSDGVVSRPVSRRGLYQQQHHRKPSASPTSPHSRRKRGKPREQVLDDGFPKRGKNRQSEFHRRNELDLFDGEVPSPGDGKAYKLYTLYRDKDGNIRQATANGCHCKPLITKLEGQLKATREEMRSQIVTVQEQVNCRLGRMSRKSKHQIKVLDMLTQERVAAERMDILYRMDQRAAEWRVEAERRQQVAVSQELKRWCMTKIQDTALPLPADPRYYKLLPSPSVDQSLTDGDLETLPLLSIFSGESSSSLATYVNLLPCPSASNTHSALQLPDSEQVASRKYFEVKLDRSPDDYENTAVLSHHHHHHHHHHSSGLFLSSTDPSWTHRELQHSTMAAAILEQNGEDCSSSVSSSQSPPRDWDRGHQGHHGHRGSGWHPRKPPAKRIRPRGLLAGSGAGTTRTLELFVDRQPEPTFSQERNHLHAVESFFDTVSTQLERWYERKIQETRQQAEIRAQQDRTELMQRITSLEEELQQLRTNGKAEG